MGSVNTRRRSAAFWVYLNAAEETKNRLSISTGHMLSSQGSIWIHTGMNRSALNSTFLTVTISTNSKRYDSTRAYSNNFKPKVDETAMGCPNAGPVDFADNCVRTTWSALLPFIFVVIICTIPLVPKVAKERLGESVPGPLRGLYGNFLKLREAEALDASGENDNEHVHNDIEVESTVPLWRTLVISFIALLESLLWLSVACYTFVTSPSASWSGMLSILIASTWLYACIRPITLPSPTPPWDLFVLFIIHTVMGIVRLGGIYYERDVQGIPLPGTPVIVGLVFNLAALLVLLGVVVSMPLGIPSKQVKESDIVSVSLLFDAAYLT